MTVRPDGALWLAGVLTDAKKDPKGWQGSWTSGRVVAISHLASKLRFASELGVTGKPGAPRTKGTLPPRAISEADAQVIDEAVRDDIRADRKRTTAFFAKARKQRLKEAAAATPVLKPVVKTQGPVTGAGRTGTQRSQVMDTLLEGALAQIAEVAAEVESNPKKMLAAPKYKPSSGLRGRFTESAQSIFAGGIDPKEARRLLGDELAPFVDGPTLALALAAAGSTSKTPDELQVELCDAFALRAIDELARGLVAVGLGRLTEIPATCATLRPLLERHVAEVQELLQG